MSVGALPRSGSNLQPTTVVERINSRYGTSFRLLGRYAVGENGAFRIEDATRAVRPQVVAASGPPGPDRIRGGQSHR